MNSTSRFNKTPPIYINGNQTFGRWVQPTFMNRNIISQTDIQKIKIDQRFKGRPDLIANNIYGTSSLDWVLIMFNRPLNIIGWPQVGMVIEAPTKALVMKNI